MVEDAAVTPQDAYAALRDGASLIDVREPWEYEQIRIPGAVLIPLGELPQRMDEIATGKDVYVHCRMGNRSARAVDFLRAHGYARSFNVAGGIDAWKEAGLPVAE